nr:guanylate-binding protein 1-like [Misgurnus anguillicaudatus]
MACGDLMSAPVCLIENDKNGKLCVSKEGKDILDMINGPVVVVSVVGLYRTGKSYLMNRLAGQQSGFALGNTIESKTKGIWMWCVPHPSMPGHTLVLLDTEGLGDVKKGDSENDGWIFCLAVLLSSTLVYNSKGTIDNNALEQLQYVVELAERIRIKSQSSASEDEDGEEASQFVCFFPQFVWSVRDFTLELAIEGKNVTEDEYLESALDLKKGVTKKISDYNLVRECIRRYFRSRKCFVFPFPASQENMPRLESLQEQELMPAFQETTDRFCKYIFNKSAVKTLKGGHSVTGKMLGDLAQICVETISSGQVPCLDNAVVTLANLENQAAIEEALQVYKNGMEEVKNKFPNSIENITSDHLKSSSLAISKFTKRSFKDEKKEFLNKLEEDIRKYYENLLKENEMASEGKCKELLKNLFSNMSERLQNGAYSQPGGYEVYCRDRAVIIEKYCSEPNKGVRAEAVLHEFLNKRADEAKIILDADKKLTENDKKIQVEKENAARVAQRLKEEKEKRIQSEQLREAEKKQQEEIKMKMEEKFKQEMAKQKNEIDRALESKLKEQEELLNKGFKEKADLLGQEIESLKNDNEKVSAASIVRDVVIPLATAGLEVIPSILMHRSTMKALTRK